MAVDFERCRRRMVKRDVARRGVRDRAVLGAMREVPRERFVPDDLADAAFEDRPLPIGEEQTISQPYVVALMAEAAELEPEDRVLEVGTGSGYGAAVLGRLARQVWTVERIPSLARRAAAVLAAVGCTGVEVVEGDGTLGHAAEAPYDAVVVTAAAPSVPPALLDQLVDCGRLVMPVGAPTGAQRLVRVRRRGDRCVEEDLGPVRFVPLVGAHGIPDPPKPR